MKLRTLRTCGYTWGIYLLSCSFWHFFQRLLWVTIENLHYAISISIFVKQSHYVYSMIYFFSMIIYLLQYNISGMIEWQSTQYF